MTLGHELVHADRSARGVAAARGRTAWETFRLPDGSSVTERQEIEELETTGLPGVVLRTVDGTRRIEVLRPSEFGRDTLENFSENAIRRDEGRRVRSGYAFVPSVAESQPSPQQAPAENDDAPKGDQ